MPKYALPIFNGLAGGLFSRNSFLSGGTKVYFGPGQPPYSANEYSPPDDWPPVGSLLRVPQVVNISAVFMALDQAFAADGRGTYNAKYTYIFSPGDTTDFKYVEGAEYRRIRSAALEAQGRISLLRPGRTYVNWFEQLDSNDEFLDSFPSGDAFKCMQLVSAPSDTEFFGVDCLDLNFGRVALQAGADSGDDINGVVIANEYVGVFDGESITYGGMTNLSLADNPFPDGFTPEQFLEFPEYVNSKSNFIDSYDKFYRRATIMFPADADADADGQYSHAPESDIFIDSFPGLYEGLNDDNDKLMNLIADDMAEYGLSVGEGCSSATAEFIVSLIADHFGFDPSNGRDLV